MTRTNENARAANTSADTAGHLQANSTPARAMSALTARKARIVQIVTNAPLSVQNTLRHAFSGTASPRAAIKAQCLLCAGFDRNEVKNCAAFSCGLFTYRPFQDAVKRAGG